MLRTLFLLSCLIALPVTAQELVPHPVHTSQHVVTHFLSKDEARKAFTEGAARAYFNNLYPSEMQAKTGLRFKGMSLTDAREKARQFYASEVQDFTVEERAALEGVVRRLRSTLESTAPLYARTPWSFMKVSMKIEGGLPHTRGDQIVLSPLVLQSIAALHSQERFSELDAIAANLLVHEQTHVLQRRLPDVFHSLITDVFGFTRMSNAPTAAWLVERGIVNPDAPDCIWAFPVTEGANTHWAMPYLLLKESDSPRMPEDFMKVGITVEQRGKRWVLANGIDQPNANALSTIKEYAQAFPNPDEYYHPNEIAADILAGWITGNGDGNMNHPLIAKSIAWAQSHLQ